MATIVTFLSFCGWYLSHDRIDGFILNHVSSIGKFDIFLFLQYCVSIWWMFITANLNIRFVINLLQHGPPHLGPSPGVSSPIPSDGRLQLRETMSQWWTYLVGHGPRTHKGSRSKVFIRRFCVPCPSKPSRYLVDPQCVGRPREVWCFSTTKATSLPRGVQKDRSTINTLFAFIVARNSSQASDAAPRFNYSPN